MLRELNTTCERQRMRIQRRRRKGDVNNMKKEDELAWTYNMLKKLSNGEYNGSSN